MALLRSMAMALLVGCVCSKAVAPEEKATPSATTAARLAALVNDMEARQPSADASAPQPQFVVEKDVVIMEAQSQRALGACACQVYRNGAKAGQPACAKVENGRTICTQQHNGQCHVEQTKCRGTGGAVAPMASPAPMAVGFVDAEVDDEMGEVYLNVNFQIHNPLMRSLSQLPTTDAFRDALASLTSTSKQRVQVITSWDAPTAQAGAAQRSIGSATATLHATFAVNNAKRRETLEALLQLTEELPEMGGVSYRVVHITVLEQAAHPLVCPPPAELIKAESARLQQELVALKEEEVQLLRRGTQRSANTAKLQKLG